MTWELASSALAAPIVNPEHAAWFAPLASAGASGGGLSSTGWLAVLGGMVVLVAGYRISLKIWPARASPRAGTTCITERVPASSSQEIKPK